MTNTTETKRIGTYAVKFHTEYKKKKEDCIYLTVEFSDDLRQLMDGISK